MTGAVGVDTVAGRYRLHELLGRGGMGEVWEAEDERMRRLVAVKILSPSATDPSGAERMAREARLAASVQHPAVVSVFDAGEHDGRPYLVMERLGDDTLADRLSSGPMGWQDGIALVAALAEGVEAIHRTGVVHRDIKPANVLFDREGRPKLGDFGVATGSLPAMTLTMAGMVIGTPSYLAPERVAGQPATISSDVYSLGVLAYEVLSGRPPFTGDTPLSLVHAIHFTVAPPLYEIAPGVPTPVSDVVARALEKDPDERFDTAADLAAALRAATSHGAVVAGAALAGLGTLPLQETQPTPTMAALAVDATQAAAVIGDDPAPAATGSAATRIAWWADPMNRRGVSVVAVAAAVLLLLWLSIAAASSPSSPSDLVTTTTQTAVSTTATTVATTRTRPSDTRPPVTTTTVAPTTTIEQPTTVSFDFPTPGKGPKRDKDDDD